ncbi:MAG: hypothetical protein HYY46_00340 [Deltaproteobacteria bacterium]|nr:hypothetical protein [Deltaproteobacteria bacterium]
MKNIDTIGVLAFGSLISAPCVELAAAEIKQVRVRTPFPVEFARYSKSRCGAPTLVPVTKGGCRVKAEIIVLSPDVSLIEAKNMLWRRETHQVSSGKTYSPRRSRNAVRVRETKGLGGIDRVLYTDFYAASKIRVLKPRNLGRKAISSARLNRDGKDGITYLLRAKQYGIRTPLMKKYEAEVLELTETRSLRDALAKVQERA